MTVQETTSVAIQRLADVWLKRLQQHDAAGCAELYSEDGAIYSFAPPLSAIGRDEITAMHNAWFDAGEINQKLALLEIHIDGDLGCFLAQWAGDFPLGDGTYKTFKGKVVTVMRRQAVGDWRFQLSSLTSDIAPDF